MSLMLWSMFHLDVGEIIYFKKINKIHLGDGGVFHQTNDLSSEKYEIWLDITQNIRAKDNHKTMKNWKWTFKNVHGT